MGTLEQELIPGSAALHHPDKLGNNAGGDISEAHFVHLKLAQDTLLNPIHRFAYDRFGPDMLRWEHCASIRDYIQVGFRSYAPSYAMTALIMLLLGVMGYLNWGRYVSQLGFSVGLIEAHAHSGGTCQLQAWFCLRCTP